MLTLFKDLANKNAKVTIKHHIGGNSLDVTIEHPFMSLNTTLGLDSSTQDLLQKELEAYLTYALETVNLLTRNKRWHQ
jgi:hypothetical protein